MFITQRVKIISFQAVDARIGVLLVKYDVGGRDFASEGFVSDSCVRRLSFI
jgi:hypothetical protein